MVRASQDPTSEGHYTQFLGSFKNERISYPTNPSNVLWAFYNFGIMLKFLYA